MTGESAPTFGIVGGLAAFPHRLAAREVAAAGGRLRRGITRQTTHVVFGRRLLDKASDAVIEARVRAERAAGRTLLSENGLLRWLGLLDTPPAAAGGPAPPLERAELGAPALDLLVLFDAFERHAEPLSFRDLILARKYAGLIAGGAPWGAIARSIHRCGAPVSLTARSLQVGSGRAIYARHDERLAELDGQLLLDLDGPVDEDADELFAEAEDTETAGCLAEAAALYGRCLALDAGDATAAFNRANCLRALGNLAEAEGSYARALRIDASFVEAWFNLADVARERGQPATARRCLERAIAVDPAYADAIFNLAALEFDAGNLAAAQRWWQRYLELDPGSEWAGRAAKGLQYIRMRASTTAG